jgi:parvulin-like peptidyl-prolyl isomerase
MAALRAAPRARTWLAFTCVLALWSITSGCRHDEKSKAGGGTPAASASAAPGGLTPELAARVLARVGDRTITLGEYATVLDRMDRFDRLRYQTADRRKQLLDEMINVELLAREAERRGLGERPETKELVRQILRDEVLRELRDGQPSLSEIPAAEVRAYYDAHRSELREPERRRIAHIETRDRGAAERALAEARSASPQKWGEVVRKYSIDKPAFETSPELAGDLGFVAAPSWGKNDNARVSEPVRAAAFEITELGAVLPRVVEDGRAFHVLRLVGKSEARDRSFEEAERTIRMRLLGERMEKAEHDLLRELSARYPVRVDGAALASITAPTATEPAKAGKP